MQEFKMQTANLDDVPELVQLINTAYRGEHSKKGWTTEAFLIEGDRMNVSALTEMLVSNGVIIRKCIGPDGDISGCAYLETRPNELYLGLLTVSPELQTKGIGKVILNDAEEFALSLKVSCIVLDVVSLRLELIDYYIRRGFVLTGKKMPFPLINKFGSRPLQSLELVELKKTFSAFNRRII